MEIAIVIPARFGSTRFPGKPLSIIAGETMIERVVKIAKVASQGKTNVKILVATDNQQIYEVVKSLNVDVVMTSEASTGSDRVLQALDNMNYTVDYVINFQGDAPLTPPEILSKMVQTFEQGEGIEVLTPVVKLAWEELDDLRKSKKNSGSSGTTVIKDQNDYAIWFSKNIIPEIRKEDRSEKYSPVLRHIGIYGFRIEMLKKFVAWPRSYYEKLEELEQLRIIENDGKIKLLDVTMIGYPLMSGIDVKEDIARAERIIKEFGELI
jgi:3-deoxy-manno-octulosonate cytidylyltransferase (CMP-KDO synthetase)